PLFNSQGKVVGINTSKLVDASNIGFALAIDNVRPLVEDLREGNGETEDSPDLGVTVIALADGQIPPEILERLGITEQAGLLVSEVTVGSGADEAGIEQGDVIRTIDGEVVDTRVDFNEIVRAHAVGDTVVVGIERVSEAQDLTVTVGRRGG
ncbi:MAG TPA: PDZ domain-containing protein, partial [Iamia sp.]|nr:PDZ domain-containing protein [Iamia sp.]